MFNKTKTIEKLAKAVVEAALSLCVCECRWYSFHYHLAAKWEREANSERTSVDDLWQLVAQLGASSRFSFCLHFAPGLFVVASFEHRRALEPLLCYDLITVVD